eukprot:4515586-Prymnesium_polylepis.1
MRYLRNGGTAARRASALIGLGAVDAGWWALGVWAGSGGRWVCGLGAVRAGCVLERWMRCMGYERWSLGRGSYPAAVLPLRADRNEVALVAQLARAKASGGGGLERHALALCQSKGAQLARDAVALLPVICGAAGAVRGDRQPARGRRRDRLESLDLSLRFRLDGCPRPRVRACKPRQKQH